MILTILKGLALATGLFGLGAGSVATTDAPAAETVIANPAAEQETAGRETAAEAAVQAIEDEAGHNLVDVEFDGDAVVLRQVSEFDAEADQEFFEQITAALGALGYEKISAVAAPVVLDLEEFQLTAEEREKAAESAVQTIEDEAGHDLVNIEFKEDSVVLRPVDSFDEQNDQEYFGEIMKALRTLGYENIAAVSKPLYVEQPEFDLSTLETAETEEAEETAETVALPEVDPEFSHVIRA